MLGEGCNLSIQSTHFQQQDIATQYTSQHLGRRRCGGKSDKIEERNKKFYNTGSITVKNKDESKEKSAV